jgi:hypothetical protein
LLGFEVGMQGCGITDCTNNIGCHSHARKICPHRLVYQ